VALPVDICNLALLRLEQPSINSIEPPFTDAYGPEAVCAFAYPLSRDAELRANSWNFAKARVSIPADAASAPFGEPDEGCGTINRYALPPDFIRLVKTKYERREIEGGYILTPEGSPLQVRYICRADPALFDPLFIDALACSVAVRICKRITGSDAGKDRLERDYSDIIAEAKRINAIENPAQRPPEDTFITVRR
jgi:hypothetical protein